MNLRDEVRMASLLEQQFPRVALICLQQDHIDVPQPMFQQTQSTWRQILDRIEQQAGDVAQRATPPGQTAYETNPNGPTI